jgi:hypothetical protein
MIFQASGFAVNMYNTGIWKGGNTSIKEYEIDITSEQCLPCGILLSIILAFLIVLKKIWHSINEMFWLKKILLMLV